MLERLSVGGPISYKLDSRGHIIPGEFQLSGPRENNTVEEVETRALNTLKLSEYNVIQLICSPDAWREFFTKSAHLSNIASDVDGQLRFGGLYHGIPMYVDVALNPEVVIMWREHKRK